MTAPASEHVTASASGPTTAPAFAHASEAELARILDYYQVEWRYEPRTFAILFNLDGAVVESFSPDFYLPEFDLYVELTTLKQSLVRKKNRKLRRLRELYPDVRIKLFYARDFKALLLKYGRIKLAASLSGEEGQARPPEVVATAGDPSSATESSTFAQVNGTDGAASTSTAAALVVAAGPARHGRSRRGRRRRRRSTATLG